MIQGRGEYSKRKLNLDKLPQPPGERILPEVIITDYEGWRHGRIDNQLCSRKASGQNMPINKPSFSLFLSVDPIKVIKREHKLDRELLIWI